MAKREAVKVITIVIENGRVAPNEKMPIRVQRTKKVRFESPDGKLVVNFPSFLGDGIRIRGNTAHQVTGAPGTYRFQCGITTKKGIIGWPKKIRPKDGGTVEIVNRGA